MLQNISALDAERRYRRAFADAHSSGKRSVTQLAWSSEILDTDTIALNFAKREMRFAGSRYLENNGTVGVGA